MTFGFDPIGIIRSPFKEKFGIPRQAGLMPEARATLEILPPFDREEAFRGLERFSHVWLIFVFHAVIGKGWRPTVRPPRLGGNRRLGVFATRSGFRPNPIGLSAVRLEGISAPPAGRGRLLHLSGVDLLDGTPVIDIKPYLPYADAIPGAGGGFAAERPAPAMTVEFSPEAAAALSAKEAEVPGLRGFIAAMLGADPRPAVREGRSEGRRFGIRVFDIDVHWECRENRVLVTGISEGGKTPP